MNNELDFNFGGDQGSGDIFGGFSADLSSLQAKTEEKIEEKVEEQEEQELEDEDDEPSNEELLKQSEEKSETNVEDSEDKDEYEYSYKEIANHLADVGLVEAFDDEDGEIDDSPEALELAISKTIYSKINEYKNSIPETGKLFLDYLEKGGDPSKFLSSLETPIDFKNIDLSKEDNQKLVIREYLKTQDFTPEEIEQEINDYEDAMMLEKKSSMFNSKLEKIQSKKQEELLKEQEKYNQEIIKQRQDYVDNVVNTIQTSNSIAGLELSKADKLEFEKYLLHADKDGLTKYQRDIQENPLQTQIELAYLKYKKYDFSKVANEARKKEARTFRKLIKDTDRSVASSVQRGNNQGQGDLSAFKQLI